MHSRRSPHGARYRRVHRQGESQRISAPSVADSHAQLNHRKILDGIFELAGVPKDKIRTISSAVDKLDKVRAQYQASILADVPQVAVGGSAQGNDGGQGS